MIKKLIIILNLYPIKLLEQKMGMPGYKPVIVKTKLLYNVTILLLKYSFFCKIYILAYKKNLSLKII